MDIQEIQETPIWTLYEKGRNYHRQTGIYVDTDRNYRMYNGDQWGGAKLGDVEPVQKNFIKPIVKYKVSVIHDNLYAIVYCLRRSDQRGGGSACRKAVQGHHPGSGHLRRQGHRRGPHSGYQGARVIGKNRGGSNPSPFFVNV